MFRFTPFSCKSEDPTVACCMMDLSDCAIGVILLLQTKVISREDLLIISQEGEHGGRLMTLLSVTEPPKVRRREICGQ